MKAGFAYLAWLLLAAGCSRSQTQVPPAGVDGEGAVRGFRSRSAVTSFLIGSLGERSLGPFWARDPSRSSALAVWATPANGKGRQIAGLPLGLKGEPNGPEKTIATVGVDTTSLVVRAVGGGSGGYAVAWTSLVDRGDSLWVTVVDANGAARRPPVELAHTQDDVVWVDILQAPTGIVCVWAEQGRGASADILSATLDSDGGVRTPPARLTRNATAWHALAMPDGFALTTATDTPPAISLLMVDVQGRVVGPASQIASARVGGNLEAVHDGADLVFAWTTRAVESIVQSVRVSASGSVSPVRSLAGGRGGARLVGLASGASGVAALWESPIGRPSELRHLTLARLDTRSYRPLEMQNTGRSPELVALPSGFAVLGTVGGCDRNANACEAPSFAPTVLRTDAKLSLVQSDRLEFDGETASLGWSLVCDDACFALTASWGTPARIRTARIALEANVKASSTPTSPKQEAGVVDVTAIASGESIADFAVVPSGSEHLVALLSAHPVGPRRHGRIRDVSEYTLSTRRIDETGQASTPVVLSQRALAVGGVSMAAAGNPKDGGAVAWVSRESGDPEVRVTRLDPRGRRTNDVQLTTRRGEASDVAIVWARDGWLVAWVDGRDGNGEVYATKVDLELKRVAREERITRAPGDASDLVALAVDDKVWIAWADAREQPKDGVSDIFVTALSATDAKQLTEQTRVFASAAHSRTPALTQSKQGLIVGWIEQAAPGQLAPQASGLGAMVATLDEGGAPISTPTLLPAAGDGSGTAIALDVNGENVRAIVARSADAISLDAVLLGRRPRAFPLMTLDGPPSLDVTLSLTGDFAFFGDDGERISDKRLRRARIAWNL